MKITDRYINDDIKQAYQVDRIGSYKNTWQLVKPKSNMPYIYLRFTHKIKVYLEVDSPTKVDEGSESPQFLDLTQLLGPFVPSDQTYK